MYFEIYKYTYTILMSSFSESNSFFNLKIYNLLLNTKKYTLLMFNKLRLTMKKSLGMIIMAHHAVMYMQMHIRNNGTHLLMLYEILM